MEGQKKSQKKGREGDCPRRASAGDAKRKQSARPSFRMSEGVLDPCPFPTNFPSISFPTTLRVSLRGLSPSPLFFRLFSFFKFPLKMSIFWLPKGPKNPSQTGFWAKSWFPKSIFYAFFGRSCIFYVFYLFCDHFSMIFR